MGIFIKDTLLIKNKSNTNVLDNMEETYNQDHLHYLNRGIRCIVFPWNPLLLNFDQKKFAPLTGPFLKNGQELSLNIILTTKETL